MIVDGARLVRGRRPDEPRVATGGRRVDRHVHARRRAASCCPRDLDAACSSPATTSSAGWPRRAGSPLGYLGDADKTARTFPVVDGVRYAVPGDRARLAADGSVELHGRDSVTINSGGEKIFAEEVEQALVHHPAVYDVRGGRPAERALGPGGRRHRPAARRRRRVTTEATCSTRPRRHLARYKLPKAFVFVRRDRALARPARPTTAGPAPPPRPEGAASDLRRVSRQLWRLSRPRTTMGPWITWCATCSRSRSSSRSSACWCPPCCGCAEGRSRSCDARSAADRRRGPTRGASTAEPCGPSRERDASPRPPPGRGEDPRGPVDVRRDRAPLRPREPDHDVPDGRRLAAAHGRPTSPCRPAPSCSTSPSGTGDLCRELRAAAHRADRRRPVRSACWRPARTGAPRVHADVLRLPLRRRRSTARPAGSLCATSSTSLPFFAELARVVRPGGRIALLEVAAPDNAVLRWGHGIYFGKVVPLIGGLLSDAAAYRYLPQSVAYLPGARRCSSRCSKRRASPTRSARCCPAASPSSSPAHGDDRPHGQARRRRRPPRGRRDRTASSSYSTAAGLAGRGVAARLSLEEARRRARVDRVPTTRSASRAAGRSRSARCRSSRRTRRGRAAIARRGPRCRRTALGHRRSAQSARPHR